MAVAGARTLPGQEFMLQRFGSLVSVAPLYRKSRITLARPATPGEVVETVVDGKVETTNTAGEGDMVVRNATKDAELQVINKDKFQTRYETPGFEIPNCPNFAAVREELAKQGFIAYMPKGIVRALRVEEEHMSQLPHGAFLASWGSEMIVEPGDFLVMPHPEGDSVYRIAREAMAETYRPMGDEGMAAAASTASALPLRLFWPKLSAALDFYLARNMAGCQNIGRRLSI